MKVLAISPFTTTGDGFRKALPADLLARVEASGAQLIVLPGYSAGITPSPEELKTAIRPGCTVFVEAAPANGDAGKAMARRQSKRADEAFNPHPPYLVTAHSITALPSQLFARSPDRSHIETLRDTLQARTVDIAGRRFTFVLCGEINGFDTSGRLKHGLPGPPGIVVNPAHTPMGRWHLLEAKLKALARRNGFAIHVANNTLKHPVAATTDVRIYRSGILMQGRNTESGYSAWCELEV